MSHKLHRNDDYLNYIRSKPCLICGKESIAHHIRKNIPQALKGGVGIKSSDYCTVSICNYCHQRLHQGNLDLEQIVNIPFIIIEQLIHYIEHKK